jgi:translation initiation factor IF-3
MGYRLLQRMAADVAELGYIESNPKQDGRNMIMVIGPHKKKAEAKAEQQKRRSEERAAHDAAAATATDTATDTEGERSDAPVAGERAQA